jgi:hypothetical protein
MHGDENVCLEGTLVSVSLAQEIVLPPQKEKKGLTPRG